MHLHFHQQRHTPLTCTKWNKTGLKVCDIMLQPQHKARQTKGTKLFPISNILTCCKIIQQNTTYDTSSWKISRIRNTWKLKYLPSGTMNTANLLVVFLVLFTTNMVYFGTEESGPYNSILIGSSTFSLENIYQFYVNWQWMKKYFPLYNMVFWIVLLNCIWFI